MPNAGKYKCPVCKKPLTKKEFERALKIHEAQEKHFEHKEREFADKVRRFDAEKKKIKNDARESERARTRRIVGGKVKEIGKLIFPPEEVPRAGAMSSEYSSAVPCSATNVVRRPR